MTGNIQDTPWRRVILQVVSTDYLFFFLVDDLETLVYFMKCPTSWGNRRWLSPTGVAQVVAHNNYYYFTVVVARTSVVCLKCTEHARHTRRRARMLRNIQPSSRITTSFREYSGPMSSLCLQPNKVDCNLHMLENIKMDLLAICSLCSSQIPSQVA